jgi:hypothetical protein
MSYASEKFQKLNKKLDSYIDIIQWDDFHQLRVDYIKNDVLGALANRLWRSFEKLHDQIHSIDTILDVLDEFREVLLYDVVSNERQNELLAKHVLLEHFQMLLLAKCTVQIYVLLLNKVLKSTFPLSRDSLYWESIRSSPVRTWLYVMQMFPFRLVNGCRHLLHLRNPFDAKRLLSRWKVTIETRRELSKKIRYLKHNTETQAICLGILATFNHGGNSHMGGGIHRSGSIIHQLTGITVPRVGTSTDQLTSGNELWQWSEKRKKKKVFYIYISHDAFFLWMKRVSQVE